MDQISIIGLDLAKGVFHIAGRNASGEKVLSRQLRRSQLEPFFVRLPPCVVAMEACGSAHHWARRLGPMGHEVRLIPPIHVKPYVTRNKTDARDADALTLAGQRPDIHPVPVKSPEQQARASLHRTRDLMVRHRTASANQIRGLAAEFGLVARPGREGLRALILQVESTACALPEHARVAILAQADHHRFLDQRIEALTKTIVESARACEQARRLMAIPGIGPLAADALLARAPQAESFTSGRTFAAWLGLTRLENSTGGKPTHSGHVSKQGDRHLRRLMVLGATTVIAHQRRSGRLDPWVAGLLARRPFKVAATALAAKMARIAWALLAKKQTYQPNHQPRLATA